MADLNIDILSLDSLILELEKDNKNIVDIIKNINDAIRLLDKSKWNSKEKEKFDEQFVPYITSLDNQMFEYLNTCTNLLKNAKETYKELDLNNKKSVDNINEVDVL